MTTLELYRKHKNGEVSREKFLYEVRRDNNLPWITNLTSYDDAVKILKNKGIVTDETPVIVGIPAIGLVTEGQTKEAKADEAVKAEVKPKKSTAKQELTLDQVHPYEYRLGLQYELDKLGDYDDESFDKVKDTVLKNLNKDFNYYTNELNAKQSPFTFKKTETDAPGMQAKADGHLKKEAKKDEKANVKDNLGKKEEGSKKPKGVKIMPDKGVTGSEKTIKEGLLNEVILKVYRYDPSSRDLEDVDVEYFGSEDEAKKAALAHHWQIAFDNGDTELSKDEFVAQTNWNDLEPYENYGYDIVSDKGNIKEGLEEITPSTNKYINRGRLNKKAIADYLKSVIDPSEIKSVDNFMRDEEGYSESSSYFFDVDDSPGSELLQAVGKYKGLGQNDDNPLYKELNNNYYNNIFFLNDKLRPKGKAFVEKVLSDFGVLEKYQQYVDNLSKSKTGPTEQEVEDWAKQEMSYYLFSKPDEFPGKMEEGSFMGGVDLGASFEKMKGDMNAEDEFEALMKKYDWYAEMSDDPSKWNAQQSMEGTLKQLAKQIGVDRAVEIYNNFAPSDRKVTSSHFMNEDKHAKLKEVLKKKIKEAISASELIQARQKGQIVKISKSATQDIQAAERAKANYSTYE